MIRTRVGYAGGEKINPTYYDLGYHSETIQIDYDPEKITYPQLLQIFWDNHNCTLESFSRQYMSIVFYHNLKQRDAAIQSMQEQEKKLDTKLVTEILPLTQFYRAEDYHQKFRLQQNEEISGELKKYIQKKLFKKRRIFKINVEYSKEYHISTSYQSKKKRGGRQPSFVLP